MYCSSISPALWWSLLFVSVAPSHNASPRPVNNVLTCFDSHAVWVNTVISLQTDSLHWGMPDPPPPHERFLFLVTKIINGFWQIWPAQILANGVWRKSLQCGGGGTRGKAQARARFKTVERLFNRLKISMQLVLNYILLIEYPLFIRGDNGTYLDVFKLFCCLFKCSRSLKRLSLLFNIF